MKKLHIEPTNETPEILLDGEKGIFEFSGKSYPENVNSFFKPVFDYIDAYKENPRPKTVVNFKWLYFNTLTARYIVKIIMHLKDLRFETEVNWICKKGFDVIIEKGQEIKEILDIDLNIVIED